MSAKRKAVQKGKWFQVTYRISWFPVGKPTETAHLRCSFRLLFDLNRLR